MGGDKKCRSFLPLCVDSYLDVNGASVELQFAYQMLVLPLEEGAKKARMGPNTWSELPLSICGRNVGRARYQVLAVPLPETVCSDQGSNS